VSTTRVVDPVTLAVVNGTLKSATREMGITLDRTSRSPVLKLARDYSNAIFDAVPQQLMQGEYIPVHLGGLIASTRGVAEYFADEIFPATSCTTTAPRPAARTSRTAPPSSRSSGRTS
jgi:N-methylhydantoinase B